MNHSKSAFSLVLVLSLPLVLLASDGFNQKLSSDKQIVHVLNRLTFGPRPTDVAEVRRLGIEKWIDLQLHPERIPESPILESRIKPLTTLQAPMWETLEKYPAIPVIVRQPAPVSSLLPSRQYTVLNYCSAGDKNSVMGLLDPEIRQQVLTTASPQMLEGLPDPLIQEAAKLRKTDQEARQAETLRLLPPLNELLSPEQIRTVNSGKREDILALLNSVAPEKRTQIVMALPPPAFKDSPELRREQFAKRQPQQFLSAEQIDNKLYRAIYSNHQLEEVLVDFWTSHFNVFSGKVYNRATLIGFERDAIRPYVFGRFRDMLLATARHPAMLYYLDNWQSHVKLDPIPGFPNERRPGLNENYARELMELHTLGVNGGYSQDDVIAVARAFTGWTIFDPHKFSEFQFNPAMHDRKEKTILGQTIPAMGGEQDGVRVIDILARHPATAKFISKKLAQRFVVDNPPQVLVDRMAATFTKTDGDLRAVLQTMFSSVEFLSEAAWQAKLKSPFEMVVSAVRSLNAEITDTVALAQHIAELGQPLYGKSEPTGYPNTAEGWRNTTGLLGRINFATTLSSGQIPGVKPDISRLNFKQPAEVAAELFSYTPAASMLSAIDKGLQGREATPSILAGLVLSSPDFQKR